jgi:hypothetical protein
MLIVYTYITIKGSHSMSEEVLTLVKIPLSQIEQSVRLKHSLPDALVDVRLEADSLVLYFAERPRDQSSEAFARTSEVIQTRRRRRARRKRNRMKTRGWEILGSMVNSKGQTCTIYRPFVEALKQPMSEANQRLAVARILRSNHNRPSESSIDYFLENTLEYLKKNRDSAGVTRETESKLPLP